MGQVPDDLDEIDAVAAEVDGLRERTQQIVAELERRVRQRAARVRDGVARVRRAVDVKAQVRAHPRIAIGVGSGVVVALGVGIWIATARALEARKPMNRLRARAQAYRALLADPHRALRKHAPLGKRLIAAVLIAGATTIVRGVAMLMVKRVAEPRLLPPPEREIEVV